MLNISVAEILKMHGEWIESEDFVKLVSQKLGITPRQAYNKIKEATEKGEILRVPLSNRRVIYGLPEFGEPKQGDKLIGEEFFKLRKSRVEFLREKIREVEDLHRKGNTSEAYVVVRRILQLLDSPYKEKLTQALIQHNEAYEKELEKWKVYDSYMRKVRENQFLHGRIYLLIECLYSILHGMEKDLEKEFSSLKKPKP
jgi:hypothetical protein